MISKSVILFAISSIALARVSGAEFTNLFPNLGESNTFDSYNSVALGSQGGWGAWTTSSIPGGATSSSYRITSDPAPGAALVKSLRITTAATSSTADAQTVINSANRYAYQPIPWGLRSAGQDYLVMNFSTYIPSNGVLTNSKAQFFGSIRTVDGFDLGGIGVRSGDGRVYIWQSENKYDSNTNSYTKIHWVRDTTFNVELDVWNKFQIGLIGGSPTFKFTSTLGLQSISIGPAGDAYGLTDPHYIMVSSSAAGSTANDQIAISGYFDSIGAYAVVPSPSVFALIGLFVFGSRRRP